MKTKETVRLLEESFQCETGLCPNAGNRIIGAEGFGKGGW